MKIQKILKLIMPIVLIHLISSCAVYGTSFECKAGKGHRCTSVSKINTMIDRGELRDEEAPVATPPITELSASSQSTQSIKKNKQKLSKSKEQEQKKIDIWLAGNKEAEEKYIN